MTIDHVAISVPAKRLDECVDFYLNALAPLGYTKYQQHGEHVGLWANDDPDFWIMGLEHASDKGDMHFAFTAQDRATVAAVHESALKAGGTCNGPPGLRPVYHENYYAAFFLDPIGNRVEVVCHKPETTQEGDAKTA